MTKIAGSGSISQRHASADQIRINTKISWIRNSGWYRRNPFCSVEEFLWFRSCFSLVGIGIRICILRDDPNPATGTRILSRYKITILILSNTSKMWRAVNKTEHDDTSPNSIIIIMGLYLAGFDQNYSIWIRCMAMKLKSVLNRFDHQFFSFSLC
jgi:hypothetical protein